MSTPSPASPDSGASRPEAPPPDNWFMPGQLARLFAPTGVDLAFWGADGIVRMATPGWCAWFGLDPSNVVGRHLHALLDADYLQQWQTAFNAAAHGEATHYMDHQALWQGQAARRQVHLSPRLPHFAHAARTGHGADGVLMTMTDATLAHAQQQQIAQLQQQSEAQAGDAAELARLRALLDWRTAMLTEHSEMLHLLSHEIRQPLNNASAAIQATTRAIVALQLPDTDPASKALVRAEHVLQQVIGTLDNTLAAGTILAAGGRAGASSDTDLPTLIDLVLHDIAADQRTRIHLLWETDTRTVQLHPALMRLTIRNLLNNALAYAPEATGVTLRIAESEDPLALVIEVADSGPGIADELRPRLFEKGSRGHGPGRNRTGAGLGLFIVRSVMQLHQGTVEALPNEPHGTIMRLVIPQGLAD